MAFKHGKNTVVKVDSTDLSAYTNSSEIEQGVDSHDVTCYGADGHAFAGGLTTGSWKMGGTYDSTASTGPRAKLNAIIQAAALVTVIRQPEGTGSTLPQDSFSCLFTKYVESNPVADMISWTAEGTVSGDVDSTAQS